MRSQTLRADDVRRARLTLMLADGQSFSTIREALGCNRSSTSQTDQVPAHIHPAGVRSACPFVPTPNKHFAQHCVLELMGSSRPPSAQSPFAWCGDSPKQGQPHGRLRGHYSSVLALTGSCARPLSPIRLGRDLGHAVFAGCCKSLPDSGPSRHYLCRPTELGLDRHPRFRPAVSGSLKRPDIRRPEMARWPGPQF